MNVILWSSDRGIRVIQYLLQINWNILCCVCENSPALSSFCGKNGILVSSQGALDPEMMSELNADVGISFFYSQIIHEPYYDLPRYRTINFHPAPLPEHRGTAGCCYALLNDYKQWGVTAHFVEKTLDTGNIIELVSFDISELRTAIALEAVQSRQLFNLFARTVKSLEQNPQKLPSYPQESGKGHYFSRKDLQSLKSVTLQEPNEELNKKIHALWYPPYEGAYIEKDGERFYLITRELLDEISELYIN